MNSHLSHSVSVERARTCVVASATVLLLAGYWPLPASSAPVQVASPQMAKPQTDIPQLLVSLSPEKPAIMLGEPTSLSFTVQNPSDKDLQITVGGDYRNALGRPDSFKVTVVGDAGQPVPQPDAGFGMGGLVSPQKLPAYGEYAFKLFLPHWATFQIPGTYKITAARSLAVSPAGSDAWMHEKGGAQIAARATTTLRVLPYNAQKMGEIIAAYGAAMLRDPDPQVGTEPQAAASRYLAALHDPRVVPYFVKLFDRHDYDWRYAALDALAPYNDDAALATLKRGMTVTGKEIDNVTTPELGDQLADNIRQTAAVALSRSPHPQAYPFLLTQLHDPYYGVRLTVLQTAAAHHPRPDLATVQTLAQDPNTTVRDEANRYLKELAAH